MINCLLSSLPLSFPHRVNAFENNHIQHITRRSLKPWILLSGLGLFLCCLALHVIVWRRWHPKQHATALLAVFFLPLIAVAGGFFAFCKACTGTDLAAIGLLHVALSCAYIQIYPAAQAFSPTLVILVLAWKSMPEGVTREELSKRLDDEFLLGARLNDLVVAGLVEATGGELRLTPKGSNLIGLFIAYRRLLGLEMGRG